MEEITYRVFSGSLDNLPDLLSTAVRIFLSSTFTDFQAERNWLMKYAVPELRMFCEENGLDFQIADMRWGVREDATDDHKTTEVCLHEIDSCQRISRGPNFVSFLGDKYGYRPIPADIEESEFKLIKNMATKLGLNTELLQTWYLCDNNQEPTSYDLQPITSLYPYYFDMDPAHATARQLARTSWWDTSEKLTNLLRKSADQLYRDGKVSLEAKHKYFMSVTEAEVREGMMKSPSENKVICFHRNLENIDITDTVAGRFVDLLDGKVDIEAEKLRERFRQVEVPAVVPRDQLFLYSVEWDKNGIDNEGNKEHHKYIEDLGKQFLTSVKAMVNYEMTDSKALRYRTELFEEVLHHLHFTRSKVATFCGREKMLNEIREKLGASFTEEVKNEDQTLEEEGQRPEEESEMDEDESVRKANYQAESNEMLESLKGFGVKFVAGDGVIDTESDPQYNPKKNLTEIPQANVFHRPVIVVGKSGSGKTALMAKAMQLCHGWFENSVAIVRFMGTSTKSSSIQEALICICEQLWQAYNIQRPMNLDLEGDFQFLIHYFAALLWKIDTASKPLVMIFDSIDQLSEVNHAHTFNWMPRKLPVGVHMLISVVSDRTECLQNLRQVYPFKDQYIEITTLDASTVGDIITAFSKTRHHYLVRKQKNIIHDLFKRCSQPLYLKLLMDMSLEWKSYTVVEQESIGTSVNEAINHLFDNMEKKHGEVLIKKGIGYLCAARDGLSEIELEDLLSLDDEVLQDTYIYHLPPDSEVIRLPPLLWKRVLYDIREYIVQRQSGGKTVIAWYHRQFQEAANQRYFPESSRLALHTAVAEYFQGIWSNRSKGLELAKGKKGSYPDAYRQVPAQPLLFGKRLFNTRKLNELPYHLIHSEQFEHVLTHLFCDPDWLFSKCLTMTFTSLMEDFRLAEEKCAKSISQKEKKVQKSKEIGSKNGITEETSLKQEVGVLEGIRLVTRMVLLAADSARRDAVNLPLILLSQFGPNYHGNSYIESLMKKCAAWCENCAVPLLVPIRDCMSKPTSTKLYTINTEMFLPGDDSTHPFYRGVYLREDLNHLYTVQKDSTRKDKICVLDLDDNGSCITIETVPCSIRDIQFVGNNRYLLLQTQTSNETQAYKDPLGFLLYERSLAAQVTFKHPTKHIAVSETGKYIVSSEGKAVHIYTNEGGLNLFHTFEGDAEDVNMFLISPDESLLVTSTKDLKIASWFNKKVEPVMIVYDMKEKTQRYLTNDYFLSSTSLITKHNLLLCFICDYKKKGTLVIFDLATCETKHEVEVNTTYILERLHLHSSQDYILIDYRDTGILNGIQNKYAELIHLQNGTKVGKVPEKYNGPYKCVSVFGEQEIYYAACKWNSTYIVLLYAGTIDSPLEEAVVVNVLTGHNQPVPQVITSPNLQLLISASMDNTLKLWDLNHILTGFRADMAKLEQKARQSAAQQGLTDEDTERHIQTTVSSYQAPDTVDEVQTTTVALNKTGDTVYVGTTGNEVQVYDAVEGKHRYNIKHVVGNITHLQLSRNGRYMIAVGGGDAKRDKIQIEDLETKESRTLEARSRVTCMAEANNILFTGTAGMEAKGRAWNIATGEIVKDIELLYSFSCVAINSLGTKIVSSLFDFPMVADISGEDVDLDEGMDHNANDTSMAGAVKCCISPDDKMAAMSSTDGSVRVIDMRGKYKLRLQQKSSAVALAFTKDGTELVSAGYRSIYVWSILEGSCRYKLTRHLDFVNDLKFDDTGRYLVTVSRDKQLVLWDYQRGVSIATFQTNCQVQSFDLSTESRTVTYIPPGIADLAILKPNQALLNVIYGKDNDLPNGTQETRAIVGAFTSKNMKTTRMCKIL